jgi:hypothetical protein
MIDTTETTAQIEFVQYHKPGLIAGDYTITVTQQVSAATQPFSALRHFTVSGERFALKPEDIHAVFPPEGSLGDHSRVLPHVAINRSTLPWEREGDTQKEGVPWLALLLFEDNEKPAPLIVKLSDLVTLSKQQTQAAKFPQKFALETGQQPDDLVTVIDVKKALLQAQLSSSDALTLLAHVRVGLNADGSQNELAFILGNRLPVQQGISTVHLVSVEGRYTNGSFDYQGAGDQDLVRLVSLKSWSFACVDPNQSFKGLLMNLDRTPSTLRLPRNNNPQIEPYLAMGNVLLPHTFRTVGKSASWYHGPLVPAANTVDANFPIRSADELLRYDPTTGLFDVSYAAAWELGRLLALQSKQFSTNLYLWKRTNVQQVRQAEQQLLHAYLPIQTQPADTSGLFNVISAWFANLGLLQGIPFNYLVPDERMLPREAIRFFWVDQLWMGSLMDGAFSIGRVTRSDYAHDQRLVNSGSQPVGISYGAVTGFLLRSDVVTGWPGLQINGSGSDGKDLTLLRMDRLSSNVLLCLFAGEVKSVAIHQKEETLHCGIDESNQAPSTLCKILRDSQGTEQQNLSIPISWKQQNQRIIDIYAMAQAIQQETSATAFTSAQFALQMTEGVEEVIFQQ